MSAVIGAVFGSAGGVGSGTAPLSGSILGGVGGVLNGVMVIGPVAAAEIFLPSTRLGHALERAPFLLTFVLKVSVYGIVIVCVIGGRLGRRLAVALAAPVMALDPTVASYVLHRPVAQQMAITFLIVGVGILMLQVARLVERRRLVDLAAKNRLPTVYSFKGWVEEGGLMSYGPDIADLFRRAAPYVDKILKGARPGDLPVEQPTKFELVINLRTAKAFGLTIPASVLLRADQVIEK